MLRKKEKYKKIKDSYVIFITESDVLKHQIPVYTIDRCVKETGEFVNDGSHIIYVNTNYKGEDPLGKLMQDFRSKKASEIHYKELADSVRHFKETEKGREIMCDAMKKYALELNADLLEETHAAEKRAEEAEKRAEEAKKEAAEAKKENAELKQSILLKHVKRIMNEFKVDSEQAMRILRVEEAESEQLKAMIA